jgi:hypothetical protein
MNNHPLIHGFSVELFDPFFDGRRVQKLLLMHIDALSQLG